jgi:hypothetical protein
MSDVHRVGRGLAPAVKNVGVWKGKMSLCFKDYSRFILQNVFVIRRREQAPALHGNPFSFFHRQTAKLQFIDQRR